MKYNYLENIKADVLDYIKENYEKEDFANLEYNELYDEMFNDDSITGNASGSYTFNAYEAEENLCHNMDLLKEACEMFGCDVSEEIERGPETCDVTIRCYLLGQVLQEVLDELRGEE